jgi:phosphatidylglycerophosphatase A
MQYDVVQMLAQRGIRVEEMAQMVFELQRPYRPELTLEECVTHVEAVLRKREVRNAVMTGLALDMLAEEKKLPEPLQSLVTQDAGLYGIDEILALSVTNIYGSIGLTNFGYLDKAKPGLVGRLNEKREGVCHTFADDLVAAIVAAAASRTAHSQEEA